MLAPVQYSLHPLQAEDPASLERAEGIMRANALQLAHSDRPSLGQAPPLWLSMLGTAVGQELQNDDVRRPDGSANVRCTVM